MDKIEFIQVLRESLYGEIPDNEVEENIRYYTDYINQAIQSGDSEETVLEKLGNPRLIARTIIDTNLVKKEHGNQNEYDSARNSHNSDSNNGNYNSGYDNYGQDQQNDQRFGGWYSNNNRPWYSRVISFLLIMLIIIAVFFLGGVAINLIFTFGFPILFIILVINFFRRR